MLRHLFLRFADYKIKPNISHLCVTDYILSIMVEFFLLQKGGEGDVEELMKKHRPPTISI